MKLVFVIVLGFASASLSKKLFLDKKLIALSELISDFEATELDTNKNVQVSRLINAEAETISDKTKKNQTDEPDKPIKKIEMDPKKNITEDDKKKALEFKKEAKTYNDYYKNKIKETKEKLNKTDDAGKKAVEKELEELIVK